MDGTATSASGTRPGTFPPVTIYTADDCHWCGKAKQYLAARGVPYVEKNAQADPAAAFAAAVDTAALCDFVGAGLGYNPAACDHTFRYTDAFLAAHPAAGADPAALRALLGAVGASCDCGLAINICMR